MNLLLEKLTYDQLFRISEPKRVTRSHTVKGPPLEIDSYQDSVYYAFNFKAYPSTTGLRHRGYIKFLKPKNGGQKQLQHLDCVVDCDCADYKYRWAWVNKQRGSSRVGVNSLNQAWNKAPKVTNPGSRPGLCIAKGERVSTERGLVPIEEVVAGDRVWTLSGWNRVEAAQKTGFRETVTVTLRSGRQLRLTPDHRVYAFNEKTGFSWIEAENLTQEHKLCVTLPTDIPDTKAKTFDVDYFLSSNGQVHYPARSVAYDQNFAELTGYMVSEGSRTLFAGMDQRLVVDFEEKWKKAFGEHAVRKRDGGRYIGNHGTRVLQSTGFVFGSYNKVVPEWIMRSKRSVVIAFLRGCYAGDGNFRKRHSTYATVSKPLAVNMQHLLRFLGVESTLKCYKSGVNRVDTWIVRTSSRAETNKLYRLLNPIRGYSSTSEAKVESKFYNGGLPYSEYVTRSPRTLFRHIIQTELSERASASEEVVLLSSVSTYFPYYERNDTCGLAKVLKDAGALLRVRIRKEGKPNGAARLCDIEKALIAYRTEQILRKIDVPSKGYGISRAALKPCIEQLREHLPSAYERIRDLIGDATVYDEVVSVQESGSEDVYDLTVENAHHFTANGIVVHNCKHLLAARHYIYGLLSSFSGTEKDTAYKLNQLTKFAQKRWTNIDAEMQKGRERERRYAASRYQRNIGQPTEPELMPDKPAEAPKIGGKEQFAREKPVSIRDVPEPAVPPVPNEQPDLDDPTAQAAQTPGEKKDVRKLKLSAGTSLPKASKAASAAGYDTPAAYNFQRKQGLGDSVTHNRKHDPVFNSKAMNILETQKLVEELVDDQLRKADGDTDPDIGADAPPAGDDALGEMPSDGADAMPPSEPPVNDSAVGANTQQDVALQLLTDIRDFMAQLVAADAPAENVPDAVADSGGEMPEEGDIEVPEVPADTADTSSSEEDEEGDEDDYKGGNSK